jgi:hypothetical protein
MKTNKEEYIEKMTAQLKEWSVRIDELETRVGTKVGVVRSDMSREYENRIRDLQDRLKKLSQNIKEMEESSGEAWIAMKTGVDHAWVDFTKALTAVREKFEKAA